MHLKKKKKKCGCRHNCNCDNNTQSYEYTPSPSTLEEHFENFTGAVGEVAEDFLGLGKKAKAKRQAKRNPSTPVIAPAVMDENTPELTKFAPISSTIKNHAENQALQVNQLASMVQPSAKAVTPSDVPTGSGTGVGSNEELYKTLADATDKPTEEAPALEQAPKGTEAVPFEDVPAHLKASTKKFGLYVVIVLIIGVIAYLKMKKKI
jgi:DNA-binding ferritin-like protein